jgi:hypothetical protein
VFTMITIFTENWLPNHIHRRVKRWDDGEWISSVMIYHVDPYMACINEWDLELIAGPQVVNSPVMFGLPPFESFELISEFRAPETVIWAPEDCPVRDGGRLLIRGEDYGREQSFSEFCRERDLDLAKFGLTDRAVVVCTRDYHCPLRNRVVLHAGAAYGSPTGLHKVRHRKLKETGKGGLGVFIEDMVQEDSLADSGLESKHQAVIDLLTRDPRFEYHLSDESLNLNGRYFIKGVPAKILKHLFESHLQEGKTDFEYRDLKRIFEITHGQKNSNFEVRFYRLIEKLNGECPSIRIEKTGRGRFRLDVAGRLQYREIAVATAESGIAA